MTRPPRAPPPPPERQPLIDKTGRRLLIGGFGGIAALLAGMAVGIPLLFPDALPRQRRGPARVVSPLLRARTSPIITMGVQGNRRAPPPGDLGPEEGLFVLTRQTEQNFDDPPDAPAPRERLSLRWFLADDLWETGSRSLAILAPGGAPGATLLAAQGGTVWIWMDGLVAFRAESISRIGGLEDLVRLNPDLGLDRPGLRGRLALAEGLVLDGSAQDRAGWAFDPVNWTAFRRTEPRAEPLPPLQRPAEGAGRAMEGRIGTTWFGLLPPEMAIAGAVSARDASGAFLPPQPDDGPLLLWRGRVRAAAADAPPAATDVLEGAAPVPGLDPVFEAGLLTAGPGRLLAVAEPESVLLARRAQPPLSARFLTRLRLDGGVLWESEIPFAEDILSALSESARLFVLAARDSGRDRSYAIHALAPGDGRVVRSRNIVPRE